MKEKWSRDNFWCILETEILLHWVKNGNHAIILDHLWIVDTWRETLRPINWESILRKKNQKQSSQSSSILCSSITEAEH